jgi:hypothetical protein
MAHSDGGYGASMMDLRQLMEHRGKEALEKVSTYI